MATDDSGLWTPPEDKASWPSERAKVIKAQSSYEESLDRAARGELTTPKKSDPLPRPGDPYRACARFVNRLQTDTPLIYFVLKDFTYEGFRYSDLRRLRWLPSSKPGQGPKLLLRFVEAEITDVELEGMNMLDIQHDIGQGVMPWVWEKPTGFNVRESGVPVITRITVSEAKRRLSGE